MIGNENISLTAQAGKMGGLWVVNIGNSFTRIARFEADQIVADERVPTGGQLPDLPTHPIAVLSVVPTVAKGLLQAWREREVVFLNASHAQDLKIAYQPPESLGNDRLANAYAAYKLLQGGIVVDCGTATTLTVVSGDGTLLGGAIMPGLGTSMKSLARNTAQLPEVPIEPFGGVWGCTTQGSIQVGVVHGHAGAIRSLVERASSELPVVLTGGWSSLMAGLLPEHYLSEPDWTLHGAKLLYQNGV